MYNFKKILITIAEILFGVNLISGIGCVYFGYIHITTFIFNSLIMLLIIFFMKKNLK